MPESEPCTRCGQTVAHVRSGPNTYELTPPHGRVCQSCRVRDRAPQGEPVRLFQPAPNVIPGQLEIRA